jgi:hypothetical protein
MLFALAFALLTAANATGPPDLLHVVAPEMHPTLTNSDSAPAASNSSEIIAGLYFGDGAPGSHDAAGECKPPLREFLNFC